MKKILKTLSKEYEMKYDEVFTSPNNKSIRQKLVPELLKSLKPRYNLSFTKLNEWLHALHKHRRDGVLLTQKEAQDRTNRRVHNNNQVAEVRNSFIFYIFEILYLFLFNI